jgi:hypothetical protein
LLIVVKFFCNASISSKTSMCLGEKKTRAGTQRRG